MDLGEYSDVFEGRGVREGCWMCMHSLMRKMNIRHCEAFLIVSIKVESRGMGTGENEILL